MADRDRTLSLRETQARFADLVMARDNVAQRLASRGHDAAFVEAFVGGDDKLDAVGRVDVYANMYFFRLLDVMREDFPKAAAALGDDAFFELITDYLDACPSRHPSVRFVGDRLPAFVAGAPKAVSWTRPWLHDLVALEWARADVFDVVDESTLTLDGLRVLPPEAFATLPLRLVAAHRVVPVAHAVDVLWRALEDDRPFEEPSAMPRGLLIWRRDTTVYHRAMEADEAALVDALASGTTFAAVCERLTAGAASEEAAAQTAFTFLGAWVEAGLLANTIDTGATTKTA